MLLKLSTTVLTTSSQDIYTCPAGVNTAIHGIVLSNTGSSSATFTLQFVRGDTTVITLANQVSLSPGRTYTWPRPVNAEPGEKLRALASANDTVVISASLYEGESTELGFNPRGEWSSSTPYSKNDVVSYNGFSYAASQSSTNQNPSTATTYWVLLSPLGYTGSQGVIGYTGSQGVIGYSGSLGYTGSIGYTGSQGLVSGKQTIWVPAISMITRSGATGPSAGIITASSNFETVRTYDFDTTTQEFAQFTVRMPKSWDEGTISFIPYWTASTGATAGQTVQWTLRAVAIGDNEAIDRAWGSAVAVSDTFQTANAVHVGAESSAITVGNSPQEGAITLFEISRDVANDNMGGDADLLGIAVLFTVNTGSDA